MAKTILRLLVGFAQFAGVAYCALVAWLFSVWMVDDAWAAKASGMDWYRAAGERVVLGLLAAAVVGAVLLVVNRGLARWDMVIGGAKPTRIALLGAAAIALATLVGAIHFLVVKPYM